MYVRDGRNFRCVLCDELQRVAFPYTGAEVTQYYANLEEHQLKCESKEVYPYGLVPCVALVGSDRRDCSTRIFQEYMSRLKHRIDDNLGIPPFQIIYIGLWTSAKRVVMTKCVACLLEYVAENLKIFAYLDTATVSTFLPVTYIYTIHLLPLDPFTRQHAIMKAASEQQAFFDGCTRVIMTLDKGVDPFTFLT